MLFLLAGSACSPANGAPEGMVLIARSEPKDVSLYLRVVCAGVVVADGLVVTAAHCLPNGVDPGRFVIYQGVTDLCDEPTRDGLPVISEVRIERDADLIYVQADGALALTETGGVCPAGHGVGMGK